MSCSCVNSSYLATLVAADAAEIPALKEALPPWTLVIGVGGRALLPEERMAVAEKDITAEVAARGLRLLGAVPGLATARVESVLDGLAGEPHWKLRYKGGVQDIFFHTTLENAPGFLSTMMSTAQAHTYPTGDVGVYLQPQHQGVSYHCEFSLPYDPTDAHETANLKALSSKAGERLIGQGAYFSRPYGEWADPVYNRDAQSTAALRAVKSILDPNNVLNPSKLCF